ncbi:MAG: protein kinase domain-containing protein [Sarcina sp.]
MGMFDRRNSTSKVNSVPSKSVDSYYIDGKVRVLKSSLNQLSKGGEGTIYAFTGNNDKEVIKIYHNKVLEKHKEISDKISYMVQKRISKEGICWPKAYVTDYKDKIIGYVMEKAYGKDMATSITASYITKKGEFTENWTRVELVKIILDFLDKVKYLHDNNILIGDINQRNVMISDKVKVYLVDTDSYQIDDKYRCNVGMPNFTAPEIIGKKYDSFTRTVKHESFAVSTLLFMVMLVGKEPYACKGGGTIEENIRNMSFSYPFYDDINRKTPNGKWEYIWNEFPYEIQKAFYKTFKENERLSVESWIEIFREYYINLRKGTVEIDIFPEKIVKKDMKDVSISMNKRNKTLGEKKTQLWNGYKEKRNIAVLELSTKAVKLLVGNVDKLLNEGFSFEAFPERNGLLSDTGMGLNNKNEMDLDFFRSEILPKIKSHRKRMNYRHVDDVYSVATAAFRSAKNNKEILDIIKAECGLNVKIISKEEEAQATLDAFNFSRGKIGNDEKNIFLIDQGGGSTEVALFKDNQMKSSYSLDLGTISLENRFWEHNPLATKMKRAFYNIDKSIKDKIDYYFKNHLEESLDNVLCISVGTVITKLTGKKGNKKQHGTVIKTIDIVSKINEIDLEFLDSFDDVAMLKETIENEKKTKSESEIGKTEYKLISRLGLVVYKHIMEKGNINSLTVSGTGLWYGIYVQEFKREFANELKGE